MNWSLITKHHNHNVILIILLMVLTQISACGGNDPSPTPTPIVTTETEATIGSDGGILEVTDANSPIYGLKIVIPAGSLNEDTKISVGLADNPQSLSDGSVAAGKCLDFGPEGTDFLIPITISIPYNDTDDDGLIDGTIISEHDIGAKVFDTYIYQWRGLQVISQDIDKNVLTVKVQHFTDIMPTAGDQHSDECDASTFIMVNSSVDGLIEENNDYDYFSFEVRLPGTVKVYTTGETDTYGYLKTYSCANLVEDDNNGEKNNFELIYEVNPLKNTSEIYTVAVRHKEETGTGNYKLHVDYYLDMEMSTVFPLTLSPRDLSSAHSPIIFNFSMSQAVDLLIDIFLPSFGNYLHPVGWISAIIELYELLDPVSVFPLAPIDHHSNVEETTESRLPYHDGNVVPVVILDFIGTKRTNDDISKYSELLVSLNYLVIGSYDSKIILSENEMQSLLPTYSYIIIPKEPLSTGEETIAANLHAKTMDGIATHSDTHRINFYDEDEVDIEPPTHVTGTEVTAIPPRQMDLTWDASSDNVGVAGYKIYRDDKHIKTVTSTFTSDICPELNTRYAYFITAIDSAGNESARYSTHFSYTYRTENCCPNTENWVITSWPSDDQTCPNCVVVKLETNMPGIGNEIYYSQKSPDGGARISPPAATSPALLEYWDGNGTFMRTLTYARDYPCSEFTVEFPSQHYGDRCPDGLSYTIKVTE